MKTTDLFTDILKQYGLFFLIANIVVIVCTTIVLFSILIDFVSYHKPKENKKKMNSWVETGTMFLYFLVYYLLMTWKKGRIVPETINHLQILAGCLLIIVGCYINVAGRLSLKHNWANQVTIYYDHTLITNGVYKFIRHPLYASLIWMLIGGTLIYSGLLAFLSVFIIFIPMMYYRAKQEEKLLTSEFAEYSNYKQRTGMFFPKIFKHDSL